MRNYTKLLITLPLVLLGACVSVTEPTIQKGANAEVIDGRLHRVDNSRVAVAYVDPDANFGQYTQVMVDPLDVGKVEIIPPSTSSSASRRTRNANWELTDKQKQTLQESFANSMKVQLEEKGDYPLTTRPGGNVLRITAVLTALAPTAPPDDTAARSRTYTQNAGTVFITIGFSDSETGEVLMVIKDDKSGAEHWGVNNSVANMAEVKQAFNYWARMIRARLDIVHGD